MFNSAKLPKNSAMKMCPTIRRLACSSRVLLLCLLIAVHLSVSCISCCICLCHPEFPFILGRIRVCRLVLNCDRGLRVCELASRQFLRGAAPGSHFLSGCASPRNVDFLPIKLWSICWPFISSLSYIPAQLWGVHRY
ncbi:hypothetical protein METBIDRAFT_215004 [Metschnikowia bicuspidata var. bicuspidata NRRL YB-4993]|uniref:Uncharacterized protein n=1 Tax=Metschnikowia bicuspidata var. bicuspidata NRRL YB-4993 TaxID=869754 RepID=A0A1A0H6G5_9ASCO|nr:hypothetical protein METBIDRAFT_215004 [Metschnikowia bicuspidata var. bicuspidata NRRL YB-4993]OBA19503.1 hypothetical protein METBIDRAFT_215004 [Metschnikowia bicuspidata var. bicuspidata NRRL YB-4993]